MELTQAALERLPLSRERLLTAPLPRLLAELEVDLFEVPITDPDFLGAIVIRRDGQVILAMPPGRPDWERDNVARSLLSHAFAVGLDPLPEPLHTEVLA